MKIVTSAQMRAIEEKAYKKYGIPSLILMENAGIAVAHEAIRSLHGKKRVVIFCGKGNNGGDGFVAARHLHNAGCRVKLVVFGEGMALKPDARVNFAIVRSMGLGLTLIPVLHASLKKMRRLLAATDLIIDAIFGTGLLKETREPFKSVITAINASRVRTLAVDVPSGLNADNGRPIGTCVRAYATVTLGLPKKGLYAQAAKPFVGKIILGDISLPPALRV